ncbi:MAG: DUF6531 domain-containing protein [Desulfobulbaceae bacterium]|nr:DUF6531 domain-containing protein [Desulfobulbaceae bacterium]
MKRIITSFLVFVAISLGAWQPLHAASVNIANGNLYDQVSVSPLSKFPVTIAYNSKSERESVFGYDWQASFDIRLLINSDGSCVLIDSDGSEELFTPNGDGSFSSAADVHDFLEKLGDNYRLNRKQGGYVGIDANGKPLEIVDAKGNATTLAYDNDNLSMLHGPNGEELAVATDSDGRITSLTSADNKFFSFTYDSNNNLTSITDPAGQTTQYGYDDNHNRISKTDPAGQTSQYQYDDKDRVVSTVNSAGETRTIEYVSDTVTRFTDPAGNATEYTFDEEQNITQKQDAAGNITSSTWDDANNRTSKTDASGTVAMTYDDKGNMLTRTDQLGHTTTYTYNELGRVISITDHSGDVTLFSYDANGNLLTSTDAMGNTTSYGYDAKGQVITINDGLGRVTTLGYDEFGNVVSMTDPAGVVTTMSYDASGNMVSMTDALGNVTTFTYDLMGRMLTMTDPKGNVTAYEYDVLGNRTAVIDANGNTTRYQYDHNQRVTQIIDALNQATAISYTSAGCGTCGDSGKNLPTALTDANGNTTSFSYDALGRLVQESDPLGKITSYQYDAKGNLISRTDANGKTISYTYDALSRLLTKTLPGGSSTAFTYDEKGRLITAANQHIAYAMTYDVLGRLLTITDSNERTLSYEYDQLGNRTQMTMPDNEKVAYSYDQANRLASIDSFLGEFVFTYDDLGRRTGLNYPNGVTTSYSYDNVGLLTEIITNGGRRDGMISAFTYTHDAVGNRMSKAIDTGKGYGHGHEYQHKADRFDYTYDAVYQLVESLAVRENKRKEKELRHKSETYEYDPVGNRFTGPKLEDIYTHNEANQMLSSRKYDYLYDGNGNLIQKIETGYDQDTWTYEYDYENRLIKVTKAEEDEIKTVSFKYDPFGRRIEKQVEEIEDGRVKTKAYTYVYDNEDIVLELVGNGSESEPELDRKHRKHHRHQRKQNGVSRFVHGPGIDEPLGLEQKGKTYFYHADGLGSIVSLTDKSGKVVQSYEYDSFGNMRHHGNHVKQPFGFTAREWDKETGLYFYRARYYDPKAGRFISKDPIGFSDGLNVYIYVQNNPGGFIDPWGLSTVEYNHKTGTISVQDSTGNVVGTFPATNNSQRSSKGPFPAGTYNFSYYVPHPESGPNGFFGIGNFVFDVPGRPGMGIHAGRKDKCDRAGRCGENYATDGCVRTTDEAIQFMKDLHSTDPLESITVIR